MTPSPGRCRIHKVGHIPDTKDPSPFIGYPKITHMRWKNIVFLKTHCNFCLLRYSPFLDKSISTPWFKRAKDRCSDPGFSIKIASSNEVPLKIQAKQISTLGLKH